MVPQGCRGSKPAARSDLLDREVGALEQLAGPLDARVDEPLQGRPTGGVAKTAHESSRTHGSGVGQ
jgi:hypothetical protein